jgi:hypothetical protein
VATLDGLLRDTAALEEPGTPQLLVDAQGGGAGGREIFVVLAHGPIIGAL